MKWVIGVLYSPCSPPLFQLTAEFAAMKLEHESLQTRHELLVKDYEQQLRKAHSALHEVEHTAQERSKVISHLETTSAGQVISTLTAKSAWSIKPLHSSFTLQLSLPWFSGEWSKQSEKQTWGSPGVTLCPAERQPCTQIDPWHYHASFYSLRRPRLTFWGKKVGAYTAE